MIASDDLQWRPVPRRIENERPKVPLLSLAVGVAVVVYLVWHNW